MVIIPSTLEYKSQDLADKLKLVYKNKDIFLSLTHNDRLELHVDLVYPKFAESRGVNNSLSLEVVLKLITHQFKQELPEISVHFMALLEEFDEVKNDLNLLNSQIPKANISAIYLPDIQAFSNLKQGVYFDLGSWPTSLKLVELEKDMLFMTVTAGKSGQKLTPQLVNNACELVNQYPLKNFLFDGGWPLDCYKEFEIKVPQALRVVSYTSFWQTFTDHCKDC